MAYFYEDETAVDCGETDSVEKILSDSMIWEGLDTWLGELEFEVSR